MLGIDVGAGNTGISVGVIGTVGDFDGVESGALVGCLVGACGATMQGPGRGYLGSHIIPGQHGFLCPSQE